MNSDELKSLMNQAEDLVQARRYNEAIVVLQELQQQIPNNKSVTLAIANALASYTDNLVSTGNYSRIVELFKDSLSHDFLSLNKKFNILSTYIKALRVTEHYQELLTIFIDTWLKLDLENYIVLDTYLKSVLKAGKADRDKAFEVYKCWSKIEPENFKSDFVKNLISCSKYLLELKRYEQAKSYLERLLEIYPNDVTVLSMYTQTLSALNQHEKAFEIFEICLKIKPDDVITLSNYGKALTYKGEYSKAFLLFEKALILQPDNVIILTNYGKALANLGEYSKAFLLFEKALILRPEDVITLTNYGKALGLSGDYSSCYKMFERALKINPNNKNTLKEYIKFAKKSENYELCLPIVEKLIKLERNNINILNNYYYISFKYSQSLEEIGKYQEAISQLQKTDMDKLFPYHANVVRLYLGRLYYRIKKPDQGNKYFDEAIANSDDKEKTWLYSARSILAGNPFNETAIEYLQQITKDSPHYAEVLKMLTLNLDEEGYFEMVNTDTQIGLSDTEMLNRAIYHKIANEISILKGIAYRIMRHSEGEYPLLSDIIQDIEDVFAEINRRRETEKSQIETIPYDDYASILTIISKTAHDISDFVNNQLAIIESKTRRAMRKLKSSDSHYAQFEKLLTQLELTQTALSDLKAINEGITIKRHRFQVKKLFEKWETTPQIEQAKIVLDIQNGDSEFNGDEEKIKSALNELVENSLKCNSEQKTLIIRIISQDVMNPLGIRGWTIPGEQKYLFIQFIDNGIGIPEDKKDWIFQPLKTTTQEGKGSGLGLFIIRKTLAKMNGYIRETGQNGARFEMYIPYIRVGEQ